MTLVHTNDIHSRLDEFSSSGLDCTEKNRAEGKCFGGIARIKTLVDSIREKDPNVYLVDAGDQFQGTMFYNYYKGNSTIEFMNLVKYDAFAIGNHEFDDGPAHLAKFIAKLTTPALSSNMNTTLDANLNGLVAPYIVLTKFNVRIGVVGYITKATPSLAQTGKQLTFEDPIVSVQRAVDELHKLGIKRIIAVSHNGYEDDKLVAANTQGVSVIVGGHSHSLLLKNTTAPGVAGPYPTEVKAKDGQSVYIVQAKSLGEYVGKLSLTWSANDKLTAINGDPIQLTMKIPQHPATHALVQEWRKPFDAIARTVIGTTSTALTRETCSTTGCALGYWVANLLRASVATPAPEVAATIGMTNTGGLRADIPAGDVTIGGILAVLPFVNMATTVRMSGKQIGEMLEGLALLQNSDAIRPDGKKVTGYAQFAGLRAKLDKEKPKWQRVSGVEVEVAKGKWVEVAADKLYDVATVDYLSQGGGDSIVPAELVKQRDTGALLSDLAIEAVKKDKEIKVAVEDYVPGVHFV
ncbi:Metallo-dependent phosphatase-like protein [Catenaria anguillulae PL171]|uniref:Metallo-dependent phosphatase-like protein n=1 Tax=Catenaria anguillulae PL171 TaxID=765915 RepID=A0A1Y2HZ67_9FUNG|nr:Metallo-dependent phosphatase-like protein [Catenaria anguillulae PL171]